MYNRVASYRKEVFCVLSRNAIKDFLIITVGTIIVAAAVYFGMLDTSWLPA